MSKREVIREHDKLGQPPFLGMPAKFHDLCPRVTGQVAGRVLDIGCGHGILLERVLGRSHPTQTFGCDLSSVLCARGASRNPKATIVQADAEGLPFATDAFDHVFMVEVLEHVPDVAKALREVRRVLRAGGTFLVAVPNRDWFHYEAHATGEAARTAVALVRSGRDQGAPQRMWSDSQEGPGGREPLFRRGDSAALP